MKDDDFLIGEIERSVSELNNAATRIEKLLNDWEQNQKWQVNDMRKQLSNFTSQVNVLLGVIVGVLAYIAYRLP